MLHLFALILGKLCGAGFHCASCLIFIFIIVESLLGSYLDHRKGFSVYHAHREFSSFDVIFHNGLAVVFKGFVACSIKFVPAVCYGNAYG